jgi:hypothetical protein
MQSSKVGCMQTDTVHTQVPKHSSNNDIEQLLTAIKPADKCACAVDQCRSRWKQQLTHDAKGVPAASASHAATDSKNTADVSQLQNFASKMVQICAVTFAHQHARSAA